MPIVKFSNVSYIYNQKTPLEFKALDDINLEINEGEFLALVGRTGCGKSTLIQHINSLLHPTLGEVQIYDYINVKKKRLRSKKNRDLRKNVGLVFQFPEYQLFEENVEKDVAFGPMNFGLKEEEALKKAHEALEKVGLNESFFKRSPFELSGGEKRRVAIAGILAIEPKLLIIDEPTAGLDPVGAAQVMELFKKIHEDGTTIILVTHDMNLVLNYANRVVVMDNGKILKSCSPYELFKKDISGYSLEEPNLVKLVRYIESKGISVDLEKYNSLEKVIDYMMERKKHG